MIRRSVFFHSRVLLVATLVAMSLRIQAQKSEDFAAVESWRAAVIKGDALLLKSMYSTNPPAKVMTPKEETDALGDVNFWTGLHASSIKLGLMQSQMVQPGVRQLVMQLELRTGPASVARPQYISMAQVWQQQGQEWRLVVEKRTNLARLQQPISTEKEIYTPSVDAHTEIKEALEKAAKDHKRVIIVFGANWCYDCHVLDAAFHRPDLAAVLNPNYEVIHIDVGHGDKNQDLMEQYNVPMKRGIPALAVLDSTGKLLVSQRNGEFENARSLGPEDLLAFLEKWKP